MKNIKQKLHSVSEQELWTDNRSAQDAEIPVDLQLRELNQLNTENNRIPEEVKETILRAAEEALLPQQSKPSGSKLLVISRRFLTRHPWSTSAMAAACVMGIAITLHQPQKLEESVAITSPQPIPGYASGTPHTAKQETRAVVPLIWIGEPIHVQKEGGRWRVHGWRLWPKLASAPSESTTLAVFQGSSAEPVMTLAKASLPANREIPLLALELSDYNTLCDDASCRHEREKITATITSELQETGKLWHIERLP